MTSHERRIAALMRFHGMTKAEAERHAKTLEVASKNPISKTKLSWNEFSGGTTTNKKSYQAITGHLPGGRSMFLIDAKTSPSGRHMGYMLRSFGITAPYWTDHRTFSTPAAAKKFAAHIYSEYPEAMKNPAPKRKTRATTQRAAESYVRRPSQITKRKPTKRLTVRRIRNLQAPRGVFPNPKSRGEVDEVYAREIFLYGQNDGDLYRQQTSPIIDNLAKKYAKGTYDKALAQKLWKYWADNATKKYGAEAGQKTGFVVNVPTREHIAALAEDYYFEHVQQESTKFLKPAKVKKNPVKRTVSSVEKFRVEVLNSSTGNWRRVATFATAKDAKEYATAYHRAKNLVAVRVMT